MMIRTVYQILDEYPISMQRAQEHNSEDITKSLGLKVANRQFSFRIYGRKLFLAAFRIILEGIY